MDPRWLFITTLLSSIPSFTCIHGFTCYVCGWSRNNDTCGDDGFSLVPDQNGYYMFNCTLCYKHVKFDAKRIKLEVLRGCAQGEFVYEPICQTTKYLKGLSAQVCACSSDYCNNVSVKYLSFITLLFMGAIVYGFQ